MDPVAIRIHETRVARGLSLQALAARASRRVEPARARGLRSRSLAVSASYLSLIENGHKVPDEAVACAIAEALGDDPELYGAWVALRKRADVRSGIAAAKRLDALLEGRGEIRAHASGLPADSRREAPRRRAQGTDASVRIRVPLIREGDDPGETFRPSCPLLDWLRLDLGGIPERLRARLDRPFAWRVGPSGAPHVPDRFGPGDLALVLRDFLPLSRDDAYAVRHQARVVFRRLLWNGRQLLLLPADGESDFDVLEATDETQLRMHVLGVAFRVDPDDLET